MCVLQEPEIFFFLGRIVLNGVVLVGFWRQSPDRLLDFPLFPGRQDVWEPRFVPGGLTLEVAKPQFLQRTTGLDVGLAQNTP